MRKKEKTKDELEQEISELYQHIEHLKTSMLKYKKQAEDLDRKKKDLEILHTVSNAVHQSFDLKYICNVALDMAISLPDVNLAMIYLVSEDRKEAVLEAHRNLTEDYINSAERVPYGRGTTWKVINSAQVYNIQNIQRDKNIGPAGKALGHRRALGIPIILEGVAMGVIFLASFNEGKFSKQEIELYTSIGNHIGIAIAKAKLYDKLEANVKVQNQKLREANLQLNKEIEERKRTEGEIRITRERQELENAIRNILKSEHNLAADISESLAVDDEEGLVSSQHIQGLLSDREYKVMIMLASGKSIKEIAKDNYLSASTVSTYRARILDKLNLNTTAELIHFAIKNNLVD